VPDAAVMFTPKEAGATSSVGRTDANGNYELYYSRGNKGAKTGEHSVTINTFRGAGEDGNPGQKETIPARYNAATDLTATVNPGNNKVDFPLKSGGPIIQPDESDEGAKKTKKGRSATGCA